MTSTSVWVLDGAGIPSGVPSCCEANASWYVDRLNAALGRSLAGDDLPSLVDVLANAIAEVQREHATICSEPDSGRGPSSTVAIARRAGDRLQLLALGDSPIIIECADETVTLLDDRLAHVARPLRQDIRLALESGAGYEAEHRERRRELVTAERRSRNRPGGYWIASDSPRAAEHAVTASYQIGTGARDAIRVLLMSDGVHRAASLLQLYASDSELAAGVVAIGPREVIRRIREREVRDPRGVRYPRTKLSDDATVAVWNLVQRGETSSG